MIRKYTKLADCPFFYEGSISGIIEIWYMKPDFFPEGIVGNLSNFDPSNLEKTHVLLGSIDGVNEYGSRPLPRNALCDVIFAKMQGENWSPLGQARELILNKGLVHTSMSVGDVIRFFDTNHVHICTNNGWKTWEGKQ